jgi:hypothetical protein
MEPELTPSGALGIMNQERACIGLNARFPLERHLAHVVQARNTCSVHQEATA